MSPVVSYCVDLIDASRHIQKARVNSYDEFADALQAAHRAVKNHAEAHNDLDSDIKVDELLTQSTIC